MSQKKGRKCLRKRLRDTTRERMNEHVVERNKGKVKILLLFIETSNDRVNRVNEILHLMVRKIPRKEKGRFDENIYLPESSL